MTFRGTLGEGVRFSVQEGTLNVPAGTTFDTLEIGEAGRIEFDLTNYKGERFYTIIPPGGLFSLPDNVDVSELVVAVGPNADQLIASYSPETGLVFVPDMSNSEAMIGETPYLTIEEAASHVQEGETITLRRDVTFLETRTVTIPVEATLDLNGHAITFFARKPQNDRWQTDDQIIFNGGGVLENGFLLEPTNAVNIAGSTTAGKARVTVGAEKTLVVRNVTAGDTSEHEARCLFRGEADSHLTIESGNYHAATLFASSSVNAVCEVTGGTFDLRAFRYHAPNGYGDHRKGSFLISGGSFPFPPDVAWVAVGNVICHDVTNTEYPYSVVPASEAPYTETGWTYHYADAAAATAAHVAKISERYFTSLADAVDAAQSGDTVTLVKDVTSFDRIVEVPSSRSGLVLTIDGDGHTVQVRTPFVDETGYVATDCTLEFEHLFRFATGDITMRNMHIMGGGIILPENNEGDWYAVYNLAGNILMENVTITRSNGAISNRENGHLFLEDCRLVRNCRYCAGGIFNYGVAVLDRTSMSENRSLSVGGGGGAAENPGRLYINNCVICNNSSTEIGGALNNYSPGRDIGLYIMNTTISGNFSAVGNFGREKDVDGLSDYGGAIGMRACGHSAEFLSVNNLIVDNYQLRINSSELVSSDLRALAQSLKSGGMTNRLYYTVYQTFRYDAATATDGVRDVEGEANSNSVLSVQQVASNVFNAYYPAKRIYQNNITTTMEVDGAQLVSKDDGSLNAELARYAPIKRTKISDTEYVYGDAVLGTNGVYTYFDPSGWKQGVIKMSYAPVEGNVDFDNLEAAGAMVSIGTLQPAGTDYMVTNYYERVGGRSFGVAGASGWLDDERIYYTVRLAGEPQNGSVTGVTLYGDTYVSGTEITLTATPDYAREFLGWYKIVEGQEPELITDSAVSPLTLTVVENLVLEPRFSDILPMMELEVAVKQASASEPADFPISVARDWLARTYPTTNFAVKTELEVRAMLEAFDSATGMKIWQDYVLGITPGDTKAKIWINSPQYRSEGRNLLRMKMNELTPAEGSKFIINYRLDKKLGFGTEATFERGTVNATGSYDVNVESDPSGLYVIDVLFIPENYSSSEEYVTTVNTAGVLRVENHAARAALAVPWLKLQPTGSDPVRAVNLVKTTNLTQGDLLYVYDREMVENGGYRAWKMDANGNWSAANVVRLDEYGLVDWLTPYDPTEGSDVPRGVGIWLERQDPSGYIYLCGQYDGSEVNSTALTSGWNLVGNPGPEPFDLTPVFAKLGANDQIIVPTAGVPKTYTYKDGAWGYPTNKVIDLGVMKLYQADWVSDDTEVPAGVGFWCIIDGEEPRTIQLDWTSKEEE